MAAKLEVKLTQLRITIARTNSVLDSNRQENIERHRAALKSITDSVNELRLAVEESKIEAKEDMAEITKWNGELDARLNEADKESDDYETGLNSVNKTKRRFREKSNLPTRRNCMKRG